MLVVADCGEVVVNVQVIVLLVLVVVVVAVALVIVGVVSRHQHHHCHRCRRRGGRDPGRGHAIGSYAPLVVPRGRLAGCCALPHLLSLVSI